MRSVYGDQIMENTKQISQQQIQDVSDKITSVTVDLTK